MIDQKVIIMSDQLGAIPLGLEQQKAARPVDPGQLESMGKRAAAQFAECGTPLNEAVVSVVKEAMLSPEQVKRVCEFANTSAYLTEFEKSGEVRNVTFDGGPANPSVVLKDLNDGSAPAIHQVKTAHYEPPTGHYKTAGASDSILAEAFGIPEGMEKAASVDHLARADASEEIADIKIRLDAVRDDLISKLAHSDVFLDDVRSDLYSSVRQEVLGGESLGEVLTAWSKYADTNQVKEAMSFVVDRLRSDDVLESKQIDESICKTAGAGTVPNPEHPVVERFLVLTKAASEHRKLETAVEIVDEQVAKVNERLGISS
jgi:hypothetical protein